MCNRHGVFSQTPHDHLKGTGCPRCKHTISKSELEFLNYYEIPNDKDHRQLKIRFQVGTKTKYCKPDGYDDKTNTIYEFLGDYWHGNLSKYAPDKIHPIREITYSQLYEETICRFDLLKSLGYNIKYIWETDWKNFKKGIDKEPKISNYI